MRLPLIVIGADETVAGVLERVAAEAILYPDTETATYALTDAIANGVTDTAEFDGNRQAWCVNVAYGPLVLGEATIGKPQRLAHTGWTLVLTHGTLDNDPAAPRRMVAGTPEGEDQSSIVWQAGPMLGANFIVDVLAHDEHGQPRGLLNVLAHLNEHPEP